MTTPVWLLDIDGVLNAASKKPPRYIWPADQWISGRAGDGRHTVPILAARPVAEFIREVHESGRAEIRWHTTWQDGATAVGELLGLPDFPVQDAPEWKTHLAGGRVKLHDDVWWKIGAALRVVEDEKRPLVWVDDDADSTWNLDRDTRARLTSAGPCLIVAPDSTTGLTKKHLRKIAAFLDAYSPAPVNVSA